MVGRGAMRAECPYRLFREAVGPCSGEHVPASIFRREHHDRYWTGWRDRWPMPSGTGRVVRGGAFDGLPGGGAGYRRGFGTQLVTTGPRTAGVRPAAPADRWWPRSRLAPTAQSTTPVSSASACRRWSWNAWSLTAR